MRFIKITVLVLALTLAAGCSVSRSATADGAPLARQVTESDHCGLTAPGLVYISNASELEKLASLPAGNLSVNQLRAIDLEREHLVLVGLGQRPTGGYGLTLESAEIIDDVLELTLNARKPAQDAMVTQALTTPCAIIAITPEDWERLRVSGDGLDTMTREQ
ncbi:protease complex subunit PrcB family protein [Marinobacter orientalis]|uniref:Protease complex subunit PrcB family protein n=1 Tax=Marinobacter orientalis TaxID=1928859 RepID=A0A7Y0RFY1_9GAMM|nr:protease complex subunit PrcB family protein [Marinobacter orientalis]NMT65478.1 protease complex subunit PrcB family protein [Marinobacter orientalis]TGX47382.1 protease complex subunit PrcB family protein [Marinobacter orientalis]